MTPLKLLQIVAGKLEVHLGSFAVAGGLAASYYRARPRLTNDVDIAIDLGSIKKSKDAASKIIKSVGYKEALGWIAETDGRTKQPIALVIGRPNLDELESTIDFLLPVLPWVKKAIPRAQDNLIDYGFKKLPTLTPEDIVIAKAFALMISPTRFQDLDDLQSIFSNNNQLDMIYLTSEFEQLALSLPTALKDSTPKALRRVVKPRR